MEHTKKELATATQSIRRLTAHIGELENQALLLQGDIKRLVNANIEQEQAHGCAMSAVEVWRGRAEEAERAVLWADHYFHNSFIRADHLIAWETLRGRMGPREENNSRGA